MPRHLNLALDPYGLNVSGRGASARRSARKRVRRSARTAIAEIITEILTTGPVERPLGDRTADGVRLSFEGARG